MGVGRHPVLTTEKPFHAQHGTRGMQRHKRHLWAVQIGRFLYANSVPFEVALR